MSLEGSKYSSMPDNSYFDRRMANGDSNKLRELIVDEFDLPEDVVFKYNEQFNLREK